MRISSVVLTLACSAFSSLPAFAQTALMTERAAASSQDPIQLSLQAYPDVYALFQQARLEQAVIALKTHLPQHENDPDYFNLLGVLSLGQKAYAPAAAAFERVVLMQPDNAGAWMDLAVASAEAGNTVLALGYFDYIEETFAPPPAVGSIIARYRAQLSQRSKPAPAWRHLVEVQAGIDTNANSGLQNSAIPITLGDERIDLSLDPSFKARRDSYVQLAANSRYRGQLGPQGFDFSFGARQRSYRTEHAFSNLDLNANLAMQRPTALGDAGLAIQEEYFTLGGKSLLYNSRLVASLERPYRECRLGLSLEAEWRRYVSLMTLNANVLWAQTGVACDFGVARVPLQATAVIRYGVDKPGAARAGGITRRLEFISQLGMPLARGVRADLSFSFSNAQDDEGYSALLEQNAARRLDRRNIRLQFSSPLDSRTDLTFTAEDNKIASNLALFQQAGKTFSLGLQRKF